MLFNTIYINGPAHLVASVSEINNFRRSFWLDSVGESFESETSIPAQNALNSFENDLSDIRLEYEKIERDLSEARPKSR